MKPIQGYHLITPGDLHSLPSNLMKIPNADFLERTVSENLCKDVISGKQSPRLTQTNFPMNQVVSADELATYLQPS
jgi:hypothetical protein